MSHTQAAILLSQPTKLAWRIQVCIVSYQFLQELPILLFLSRLPESERPAALLFCPAELLSHAFALLLGERSQSLQLTPKALHILCRRDKRQQSATTQAADSTDLKPFQFQARRSPAGRAGFGAAAPGRGITRNKVHEALTLEHLLGLRGCAKSGFQMAPGLLQLRYELLSLQ